MRKKTIAWLFIIGIIVAIVGGIIYGVGIAGAVNTATVNADGTVTGVSAGLVGTALVGLLVIVLGSVFGFISWIGALVATGKQGRWGWFVCIFLFSGIAEIVYLIAGPGLPARDSAPVTQG
jgi:hypothetical protein